MGTSSAADPATAAHTGHVLAALGFMVAALLAVALVEQLQQRRAAGRKGSRPLRLAIVAAGVVSGGIHLAVLPEHWAEAQVYGVFFLLAGTLQVSYGALLLVSPSRGLLLLNALATLGLFLVWLQSRSVGVALGPAQGQREPLGVLDGTSALLELVVLVATAHVLRRPHQKVVPA